MLTIASGVFADLSEVTIQHGNAEVGGAIDNSGTLSVTSSTLIGNSAQFGGGIDNAGTLSITSSTFSGDAASAFGGAIANSGTLSMTSSTIVGGSAGIFGGAILSGGGTATLAGDILAKDIAGGECTGPTALTDAAYNVSDDSTCGFSSANGSVSDSPAIDGYLGPLDNYGGPTETIPLLAVSTSPGQGADPALGLVPASATVPGSSTTICSLADQRGATRASPCDAGAFELYSPVVAISSVTPSPPIAGEAFNVGVSVTGPISAPSGPTPSGTVVVSDGTQTCDAPLSGSGATPDGSCQLTEATPGTYDISASYGGDAAFSVSSTSAPTDVVVAKVPTVTSLSSSTADPSLPGAPVKLVATVTVSSPGTGTPSGTVSFSSGKVVLCKEVTLLDKSAHCSAVLPLGAIQTLTATYSGDSLLASSSGTFSRHVEVGYWTLSSTGQVTAHGDAHRYGSLGAHALPKGVSAVGIAASRGDTGYWIAESDGRVVPFGSAAHLGDMYGKHLNAPLVGIVAAPGGLGYWLVAGDGGVFSFGSVTFHGSGGSSHLRSRVVAMALLPSGSGYELVEANGAVLTYTHAATTARIARSSSPAVGAAAAQKGLWVLEANGTVLAKSGAPSLGSYHGASPAVAITATADRRGYWVSDANGTVHPFGDAVLVPSKTKPSGRTVAIIGL